MRSYLYTRTESNNLFVINYKLNNKQKISFRGLKYFVIIINFRLTFNLNNSRVNSGWNSFCWQTDEMFSSPLIIIMLSDVRVHNMSFFFVFFNIFILIVIARLTLYLLSVENRNISLYYCVNTVNMLGEDLMCKTTQNNCSYKQ